MSDSAEQLLHGYDKEQVKLMEEKCILVNEQDNPIGFASKRDCHLLTNINAGEKHNIYHHLWGIQVYDNFMQFWSLYIIWGPHL